MLTGEFTDDNKNNCEDFNFNFKVIDYSNSRNIIEKYNKEYFDSTKLI